MSLLFRLVAVPAILLLIFGCSEEKNEKQNESRAVPVELASAETRRLEETVRGVGSFEALEDVRVEPEISGRIVGIHFTEGDRVQPGQLLFTLNDAKLQRQVDAQRSALDEARSELANARRDYDRRRELPAGLVARENIDRAQTAVQTAESRVERLEAELGRLREMLSDTRINASVPGRIGARQVDVGDYVSAGDELATVVNTSRLKIAFTIAEATASRAAVGQDIEVRPGAFAERSFSGTVYFLSPRIIPESRSLLIKAYVDDPENLLRPGGFATVDLVTGVREQAVVIPEEALVPTQEGYRVFVIEEGRAHRREIRIGLRKPGIVEIVEGLAAGEKVVRTGHMDLVDGDAVRTNGGEPTEAGDDS
ncbi:MAG TPA: efflux RND transporter periplasmic adaptor subunit [Desulfuromonadales bacterium]|nr:efflux RND transporter periplasmic adaptor subunit [Desulfuromonadales bacterium]